MTDVTLSATPKGNGYQATVTFAGATAISSAETYPTMGEAIAAAAVKLLHMPERLDAMEGDARRETDSMGKDARPGRG